jgi:hypothetical protein
MKTNSVWLLMALCLIPLLLTACGGAIPVTAEEEKPITIEHLEDEMAPTRAILSAQSAKRLDIQTAVVQLEGTTQLVIPTAALLYDSQGGTWVYANPVPLTFIRIRITVDRIDGDLVYVSSGLTANMKVVTSGAVELYGSEIEFEEE